MSVVNAYQKQYQQFLENPEQFWQEQANRIAWYKKPTNILSVDENEYFRWYTDGELNTSYLCLDYHVEQGRGEQAALIYDSPVTDTKATYTYRELRDQVALFAGGLKSLGVEKGDRVVIYMPMVPEAAIAMLACARLGAIHSVVFGGFAPDELAVRIDDAHPKVIVTASCGIEINRVIDYKPMVDEAFKIAEHKPRHVVLLQRPQSQADMQPGRDVDWQDLVSGATPAEPVPVKGTDPLYILYTSGTTGKPKGVVRDNGGHAVAMCYSMDVVYNVEPGDVYWAASDVGWVVGHSYIVYAPLLTGCTTILYEGKPVRTPDSGAFWRVCAEHGVKTMFTAPTAFRAVRKEDPEAENLKQYDLSKLERIYLAGERLDPPTYEWLKEKTKLPVIDHWWQTETAWAIAGNPIGLEPMPTKPGSATVPMPGYQVQILNEAGEPVSGGEKGNIAIKLPLPPGTLATIWGNHPRFEAGYLNTYPGYYLTGDEGYLDEENYLFVMGRCDDVINVAGHRLSTGQMEEIVGSHPAVAECAVIGISDSLKGQLPLGLVVLKDGASLRKDDLAAELKQMVRAKIGAVGCYDQSLIVQRLPKTRSGKILRRTMRQIADGESYNVPSTIDDPAILDEISQAMKTAGRPSA
ncbi:propionyl-CoA synthetase [Porticoccus litoralis]|jgi:propionyl-CoA synthetase|uniref:Propionyl-CoA synthetase n=1 Tax=Porticoccus litoralis TaxID=434086 RepID=A0AAW8AZK3_9GAMM|nr:propionyl-CoA synthetase [Porticoccus litoralis]MDP1519659.1 propionyl-CoA synthetase [Porticoccus litoralis]